ncbi:MAG: hypothetical protein M3R55_00120 [Acidobacteriota bacterium]|nr:hypothetical protein [Acidobacteriota bacterium]
MMTLPLRATLAASVFGLAWIFGGTGGMLTVLLFYVSVVPGLTLGFALFGPGQAASYVAGALIGYGLMAFAFWLPIELGAARPAAFFFAWVMVLLLANGARSLCKGFTRTPLITLPEWTTRDAAALLLVLHLVPILVGAPFARAGERDEAGTRHYRAYFTADFVWHMALTRELARFEPDLRNPYLADEPLHYYWTYFLPAAVIATRGEGGPSHADFEGTLKIHAMLTAMLLLSMIYLAAWVATGRRWAAMTAAAIALLAPSFEGLYALNDLRHTGRTLDYLRDLNIDAMSRWAATIQGLRVDNLPRAMWWTPQHSMSCATGLISVLIASRGQIVTIPLALVTGLTLALSLIFNPLLGAIFCAVYGLTTVWDLVSRRLTLSQALPSVLAVLPVGIALWWCFFAGMSAGAEALSFGLHEYARKAPLTSLFLSLGGVLIPAAIGLLPSRHVPLGPVVPALAALVLGLLLMHYVTITESSWVGFRAGNIILVTIAMLVARGLVIAYHRSGRVLALTFAAVIFAAGVPTTAIDWYNARDLENRRMGPGFLWVIPFSAEQQAGFDWVRRATDQNAVVQFDPIVRARQNWSGLPTFTGRRMAAAIPISLLPEARHDAISARVHRIYTELDPAAAHAEARAMRIDYLWIDEEDRAAPTGAALDRLLARPDLFPPMYTHGRTVVLAVAR